MTKRKSTKRALLLSALSLLMCVSMLIGSTFAWFTDSVTSAGNKIQAGNLILDLELLDKETGWKSIKKNQDALFTYEKWEPGYTDVKILKIENEGNLALKWYAQFVSGEKVSDLADVIDVYVCPSATELDYPDSFDAMFPDYIHAGTLKEFINTIEKTTYGYLEGKSEAYLGIALHMQEAADNKYQNLTIGEFDIRILATQNTVEEDSFDNQYDKEAQYPSFVDKLEEDPTYDWYFSTIEADPNAEEFTLNTAEDLAGLVALVEGTAASPLSANQLGSVDFNDKIINLNTDVDLYVENDKGEPVSFDPIGSYRFDQAFKGTFDGQGHTIYNLNQNTWELNNGYYYNDCGLGLFGAVEDATIKNLTIDGADISGESALCGTVAAVAAGECTFENITIKHANVADYQYYAGGIVGWASGKQTFKDCVIDETVVVGGQWGDFDNSNGGLIGGTSGSAEIFVKDCTIACRIDAYNDVTSSYQWYAYRRCGMIIGNSGKTVNENGTAVAAAPQLTCENVTVIYGDWANYTYCEFAGTSWPYVRVQEGTSTSAYSNPRYGQPTDANGNKVVDDNHVHNDGEDHFIQCTFDQLYGGGQGVYGAATHEGVAVIYNNK